MPSGYSLLRPKSDGKCDPLLLEPSLIAVAQFFPCSRGTRAFSEAAMTLTLTFTAKIYNTQLANIQNNIWNEYTR